MKVFIGSSSPVEMTSQEAAEAMKMHFSRHGANFDSIDIDEVSGETIFKMTTGVVVIRPKSLQGNVIQLT